MGGYKPVKSIIIYDGDLIALLNRLGRLQDLRPGASLKIYLRQTLPVRIKELQTRKAVNERSHEHEVLAG